MPHPFFTAKPSRVLSVAIACIALAATSTRAQTVDPDPEIFDGTRTKKDQIPQDPKKRTDQWEDANLILYDSDEQGSAEGGQGRAGHDAPGYADGGGQGGVSVQAGLPLPMAGGGAGDGQAGMPPMPGIGAEGIPTGEQGQDGQQSMAGANPSSSQSTPTQNGQGMAQGQSGKPGDVSIGDPSQRIAQSGQPVNKVQGGTPPPATGEEAQPSKGEDTTTIPNSASGQQSQKRGGGVEKGDAMPTDI